MTSYIKHKTLTREEQLEKIVPSDLAKDIVAAVDEYVVPWKRYAIVQEVLNRHKIKHTGIASYVGLIDENKMVKEQK